MRETRSYLQVPRRQALGHGKHHPHVVCLPQPPSPGHQGTKSVVCDALPGSSGKSKHMQLPSVSDSGSTESGRAVPWPGGLGQHFCLCAVSQSCSQFMPCLMEDLGMAKDRGLCCYDSLIS